MRNNQPHSNGELPFEVRRSAYLRAVFDLEKRLGAAKINGLNRVFIQNAIFHLNEAIIGLDKRDFELERMHRIKAFGFRDDEKEEVKEE